MMHEGIDVFGVRPQDPLQTAHIGKDFMEQVPEPGDEPAQSTGGIPKAHTTGETE